MKAIAAFVHLPLDSMVCTYIYCSFSYFVYHLSQNPGNENTLVLNYPLILTYYETY